MKPSPEQLEHLVTLCDPNASFDFSDVILVRDTTDGKLYAFENHTFPTDFTEIRNAQDFLNFVDGVAYTKYDQRDIDSAVEIIKFIRPESA